MKIGKTENLVVCGLRAKIIFIEGNPYMEGHYCGYVEIPVGNIYHGKDYDSNGEWITTSESETKRVQIKPDSIDVHGGVTYAGVLDGVGDDAPFFWGFDCAHYQDTLEKCDRDFVLKELVSMADQVNHITKEYKGRVL